MSLRILPLMVGLLVVTALSAQEPEQRTRIESLRDSLGSVTDTVALAERESLTVERARRDRDNPMLHIELGFLNYRLGELTESNRYYDVAAGEFEWATDLRPEWPFAWYGLGLAELALGEHDVIAIENIRQVLGIDALSKAARSFARAAEVDPTFVQAVIDLAAAARQQRINTRMHVALAALRRTAATDAGSNPELQLALGRVSRDLGEADSALVAFRRYLEVGGDSALGSLEVARTEFLLGRFAEAREHYYQAAAAVSSERAEQQFRYDIQWIAEPEELEEFDALDGEGLDLWLEAFWGRRDAYDLRAPGERLAEHYRRYFHAVDNFALLTEHRHYDIVERFRSEQTEIDDRGVIYIRHGAPDEVATYNAPNVEPNESWQYRTPDGDVVYHFVAREDVADYKLVESLVDVYGFDGAMAFQTAAPGDVDRGIFVSRNHLNSIYRRLSTSGSASLNNDLANERRMGELAIEEGTTTDSYSLRFRTDMQLLRQSSVVSDARGSSTILVAYAVEGRELEPRATSAGFNYNLQVRLSTLRDGKRPVSFLDTSRVFTLSRVLGEGEYLTGLMTVDVTPGEYMLRLMVADPVSGAGTTLSDTAHVLRGGRPEPEVGDFVVGYRGWGLDWPMADDTVYMNPTGLVPVGSQLDVHYELYGLALGTPYRAKIEVRKEGGGSIFGFVKRIFGGGGDRVSVEFPAVSAGPVTPVDQVVDVSSLDPGTHTVKLTVEFEDGRSVEREHVIEIWENESG